MTKYKTSDLNGQKGKLVLSVCSKKFIKFNRLAKKKTLAIGVPCG